MLACWRSWHYMGLKFNFMKVMWLKQLKIPVGILWLFNLRKIGQQVSGYGGSNRIMIVKVDLRRVVLKAGQFTKWLGCSMNLESWKHMSMESIKDQKNLSAIFWFVTAASKFSTTSSGCDLNLEEKIGELPWGNDSYQLKIAWCSKACLNQ